ncbi:MAG: transglycosylase SLT domain-containing protein [Epsilonproteobacteria bacterium]|nr:transglycosylase SLT domain-containing protein [Campylobacterota bacterium]
MKKIIILLLSVLAFGNEFDEYLKTQKQEFKTYKHNLHQAFLDYSRMMKSEYTKYQNQLYKYWQKPILSTKTRFVEYSKDKKSRVEVDYKNRYIKIDVLSKSKQDAYNQIRYHLHALQNETIQDALKKDTIITNVNKRLQRKYPQLITTYMPPKQKVISDVAVLPKKPTNITAKPSKLKNYTKYTLLIPLPKDIYIKKAKLYKADVNKRAREFHIYPALIYAIIQTESSFNPLARSYIPAFGLMQIVPQTAGADAYKMLTGQRKILTPYYLYNPHNNILIGSAYLRRIYYGYARFIKNKISRLYCTIAAYNTGIGNVACAFNSTTKDKNNKTVCIRSRGDYNILSASIQINKLSPYQVYMHLLHNLRYDEPKEYLKKVSKRLLIYKKALNANKI